MKIIHTSDWHLGHQLYGYDRTDEFLDFFDKLETIIVDEKPDAMLVSGDIFDVSSPSAMVAKMFKDNLLRFHRVAPEMTIVVTAGNHDSASRIDVDRNLWKAGGIHVIGSVKRSDGAYDFSENIITVPEKGIIAAIPFVNRTFMPRMLEDESQERSFFRGVENEVAKVNKDGLPTVLMAHLAVAGCDREGHRDNIIGGLDSMDADVFGDFFDYVALGHIHKRQIISKGRVYYSGSPMAIGFDEAYNHSVCIVEVSADSPSEVRFVDIEPLRRLMTYPSVPVEFKKALKMLVKLPDDDNSYIRLNVRQDADLPYGCAEMAAEKAVGKQCRYCTIKYEKGDAKLSSREAISLSATEFIDATPIDIAGRYFRSIGIGDETASRYLEMISGLENEIKVQDSL